MKKIKSRCYAMNGTLMIARERQPVSALVRKNGSPLPRIAGIPLLSASGPSELRDAKVGIPANRLKEYLELEGGPVLGLDLDRSLRRLLAALDGYRFKGKVPTDAISLPLDTANQRAKGFLINQYKNTRIRMGMSSCDDEYLVSETLLKVADTLAYYLEPDGDRVIIRFLQGPFFESQIKVEGHSKRPMPEEVKGAVCALLGIAGAELLPNGNSYVISVPNKASTP
jgi:hypothetical protein